MVDDIKCIIQYQKLNIIYDMTSMKPLRGHIINGLLTASLNSLTNGFINELITRGHIINGLLLLIHNNTATEALQGRSR